MSNLFEAYVDLHLNVAAKRGDEANVFCFNPSHDESRPSCWVNMETGAYFCFSCGFSGSLAKGSGVDEMQLLRQQIKKEIEKGLAVDVDDEEETVKQVESTLARYRTKNHRYWQQRNLSVETQDLFDLGYDAIADAVTLPMRTTEGRLLGVCRRFLASDWDGDRYKYPKSVKKSQILFGAHLYNDYDMSTVYVTEGAIDAMRIWQVMGPAVAIYGSSISAAQIDIMEQIGVRKVIWFGDSDDAGQRAKHRAAGFWYAADGKYKYKPQTDLTKRFWFEHVTDHQGKKDAGEMTDREIVKACQSTDFYRPDIKIETKRDRVPLRYLMERSRYNGK